MTPDELIVQTLAVGAAAQAQDTAVRHAYTALRTHLIAHYPTLDLTPVEKRPESAAKRASLAEDLGETGASADAPLLALAAQLAIAVATHQPQQAEVIAVDLDTVQAELIRLSNIRASGKATRLRRVKAKRLVIDDAQAGAGDASFQAEVNQSTIDKLEVNLLTGGRNDKALAARYVQWVLASLNRVQLDGIDPDVAKIDGASRLKLSAIYTALLTKAPDFADMPALSRRATDSAPRHLSAVEQLNKQPRLVLLGDPGSGKSTFVDFVALCLAGELAADKTINHKLLTAPLPLDDEPDPGQTQKKPPRQPWRQGALLPVRVILRDLVAWPGFPAVGVTATAQHLWRFIEHELQRAEIGECAAWLYDQLQDQGGLILLDGLDEVPEADNRRGQIKQAVTAFTQSFSRCRFLVSGRPYAYADKTWQLDDFAVAELAPFSRGQIRRFIEQWYAQRAALLKDDPDKARARATQLQTAIFANPRLYELAERPLLLTLTAGIHAFRQGQLPEGRAELYDEAVKLLLLRWEDRMVPRPSQSGAQPTPAQTSLSELLGVERSQLLSVLQQLAFAAHTQQPNLTGVADIAEGDLLVALQRLLQQSGHADIPSARLIHYLKNRTGLLIERAPGVYASPHRTFQEFLAACHLTTLDNFPEAMAELVGQEPNRWREVTLLAAAKTHSGGQWSFWPLVDALCFRAPEHARYGLSDAWGALLAAQAIDETIGDPTQLSERNQEKVALVRRGLVHGLAVSGLPARERALAGRVLAKLGDPRPQVLTVAAMPFCAVPAGDFYHSADNKRAALPSAFWIGRWPVSNAQFGEFVAEGGYHVERYWAEAQKDGYWTPAGFKGRYDEEVRTQPYQYPEPFTLLNHPVVGVSWYEAVAFCRWLSEQTAPHGWQVRLPTAAEWEKAARGGLLLPALNQTVAFAQQAWRVADSGPLVDNLLPQRRYPWGAALPGEAANYAATQINATSALGCFASGASPYGVEDLSGNVWEWSNDDSAWGKVLCGGAYYSDEADITTSARLVYYPFDWYDHFGLRCVVVPIARV